MESFAFNGVVGFPYGDASSKFYRPDRRRTRGDLEKWSLLLFAVSQVSPAGTRAANPIAPTETVIQL